MKYISLFLICSALCACATTTKPTQTTAAPANTTSSAPTPTATTTAAAATATDDKLNADKIMELQRAGYKIVNRDGQMYFCSKEKKTGSHLARETVCMTQKEAEALRDATQRRMGEFSRQQPPPQGK